MIIPMIASLSEDAMSAVPNSMREGALGSRVYKIRSSIESRIPAAISGIIASLYLLFPVQLVKR